MATNLAQADMNPMPAANAAAPPAANAPAANAAPPAANAPAVNAAPPAANAAPPAANAPAANAPAANAPAANAAVTPNNAAVAANKKNQSKANFRVVPNEKNKTLFHVQHVQKAGRRKLQRTSQRKKSRKSQRTSQRKKSKKSRKSQKRQHQ